MVHKELFRLPQAIVHARRTKGVSQKALAIGIGIDGPRLSAIEHGRTGAPGADLIEKLSDELGLAGAQREVLAQAAAHDRVMREVVKNLDQDKHQLMALSLDAARLLTPEDRAALAAFIQKLVGPRDRFASLLQNEEAAMN